MCVSVIIPCWNEASNLPRVLARAREAIPGCEIVAACAPSTDQTVAAAEALADRVVFGPRPHRAAQMNGGAAEASGDLLLFLHADTLLPSGAGDVLAAAARGEAVGGGFARRFDSPSRWLALTCWLAEARCRAFGWFLGDQAIFVRARVFRDLGGYRLMDRFEDLDFARRLKSRGRVVTLRPPVVSSARRFQAQGPVGRTLRDLALTVRYLWGDWSAVSNMKLKDGA
jgi:rSAM/selenodomain-associated transferase 2